MSHAFEALTPAPLWNYFAEICLIPRPSKKEEQIVAYLVDFCKKHALDYKQDKVKNLVVFKAASPGMENRKKVILQSHVDMVCEKNKETVHDFLKDPIRAYVDGDWAKAKGTTLGADNGIGVATMLAVLSAKDMVHGPLECLFTVDEESGLTGAHSLESGFIKGDILLNLDTEDEGIFTIGCAGGLDTVLTLSPELEALTTGVETYQIEVKGLSGGHSGVDINKGLASAIKVLGNFLFQEKDNIRILSFSGGNLRNAIAREAHAVVAVPAGALATFQKQLEIYSNKIKSDFQKTEPNFKMLCEKALVEAPAVFSKTFGDNFLEALVLCPHGVLKMSEDIPGLVETSTNLASVKKDGSKLIVTTSQRSSKLEGKVNAGNSVTQAFAKTNAVSLTEEKYPGWTPNVKSEILQLFKSTYKKLFSKDPVIEVIHAGLECGLIGEKEPHLDMLSIGPTIKAPHSPDEKLEISSVQKFWDLLVAALKEIPVK